MIEDGEQRSASHGRRSPSSSRAATFLARSRPSPKRLTSKSYARRSRFTTLLPGEGEGYAIGTSLHPPIVGGIKAPNGGRARSVSRSDPLSPSAPAASAALVSRSPDASAKLTATPLVTPSANRTPAVVPMPTTAPPAVIGRIDIAPLIQRKNS